MRAKPTVKRECTARAAVSYAARRATPVHRQHRRAGAVRSDARPALRCSQHHSRRPRARSSPASAASRRARTAAVGKHPAVYEDFIAWGEYLPGIVQEAVTLRRPDGPQHHQRRTGPRRRSPRRRSRPAAATPGCSGSSSRSPPATTSPTSACSRRWTTGPTTYSAFNENGSSRGPAHSTFAFRQAWKRVTLIMRGGSLAHIDAVLARLHMPPLRTDQQPPHAAGGDDVGAPDARDADDPRQSTARLLAGLAVGRLGRHRLLLELPPVRLAVLVLPGVPAQAVRVRRVGALGRRQPLVRHPAVPLGVHAPAHADDDLQPGPQAAGAVPALALPRGHGDAPHRLASARFPAFAAPWALGALER